MIDRDDDLFGTDNNSDLHGGQENIWCKQGGCLLAFRMMKLPVINFDT